MQLRDVVATELVNQQIYPNHFLMLTERGQPQTSNLEESPKRSHVHAFSSELDFEDICKPATKRKKTKQLRIPLGDITQKTSSTDNMLPLTWNDLDACLRCILPDMEGITYVVSELTSLSRDEFSGAPSHAFESTVRMNITTAEAATKIARLYNETKHVYVPTLKMQISWIETGTLQGGNALLTSKERPHSPSETASCKG